MRKQVIVFLALFVISYLLTMVLSMFVQPAPLANLMGFLSLLAYAVTLLPTLLRLVVPATKKSKKVVWLLKYRRHIGVAAFGFGLNHGILLAVELNVNFMDWNTYIHYFQGIAMMAIFTALTFTSNDESVKKLKKNWRKLHQLTYAVIFLLPWHILDKMSGHWTNVTPLSLGLTGVIAVLFARRKWLERVNSKPKLQPVLSSTRTLQS